MQARWYLVGAAAFAALMTGGIGAGLWLTSGVRAMPPVEVSIEDDLRWVVVGNTGEDTPAARQVREAASLACEELGCTGVLLVGDLVPEDVIDAEDPRLDTFIGEWARIAPVRLVFGNEDHADPRRLSAILTWARAQPDVHAPSTAWTAQVDGVRVMALDSEAWMRSDEAAQEAWIADTLRASSSRWRVAALHDQWDPLAGKFNLVVRASPGLSLGRRAGTVWLSVGAGASPGIDAAAPVEERAFFAEEGPGFAILSKRGEALRVRFVGVDAQTDATAVLTPDGNIHMEGA